MSCDRCDTCPELIVLAPRAFRRVAERVNGLAQRLELAADQQEWAVVEAVTAGLAGLLIDLHMCRLGECQCTGKPRPYAPPELVP